MPAATMVAATARSSAFRISVYLRSTHPMYSGDDWSYPMLLHCACAVSVYVGRSQAASVAVEIAAMIAVVRFILFSPFLFRVAPTEKFSQMAFRLAYGQSAHYSTTAEVLARNY